MPHPVYALKRTLLCLITCIFLTACGGLPTDSPDDNEALTRVCDELFIDIVQSDSITLNYTLSNPAALGITDYTPTLGSYSDRSFITNYSYYENKLSILQNINYSSLTDENKLLYDTLYETLKSFIDTAPYMLYSEPLSPLTGIQSQLPVLLSEYHYYTESSIEEYFKILECIPDYFEEIIEFENSKKNNGLFMGTPQAHTIIGQCRDFIKDPDSNMLIQTFTDNISHLGLDSAHIREYAARNEHLVKNTVIPAYRYLIDSLTSLMGTGSVPCRGMCSLQDGKSCYTSIVHMETNSSMGIKDMMQLLESTLDECHSEITERLSADPGLYDRIKNIDYTPANPENIINYLKDTISNEYPQLPNSAGALYIKYVHPSLENTLSPAMYITPPIDCDVPDSIYINRSCCNDSAMFATLAHEGYPGHLYQTEYFMSTNPHPLRLLLGFSGYSEGWATYAELYSYSVDGFDNSISSVLRNNKLSALCIYAIIDLGIHYYGWSYKDCLAYLEENGIIDTDVTNEIYFSIISEPALYLKYTIGCLEFIKLEEYYRSVSGTSFDPVKFHKMILELGPTWFDIISNKIKGTTKGS